MARHRHACIYLGSLDPVGYHNGYASIYLVNCAVCGVLFWRTNHYIAHLRQQLRECLREKGAVSRNMFRNYIANGFVEPSLPYTPLMARIGFPKQYFPQIGVEDLPY